MTTDDDLDPCVVCGKPTANAEDDEGEFLCSPACAAEREAERVERAADAAAAYAEYRAIWPDGMKRDGPQTPAEVCEQARKLKR